MWTVLILSGLVSYLFRFVLLIKGLLVNLTSCTETEAASLWAVERTEPWLNPVETASSCLVYSQWYWLNVLPHVKAFMGLLKAESHMKNVSQANIYLSLKWQLRLHDLLQCYVSDLSVPLALSSSLCTAVLSALLSQPLLVPAALPCCGFSAPRGRGQPLSSAICTTSCDQSYCVCFLLHFKQH